VTVSIAAAVAAGAVVLALTTDLDRFLVYAVWVAPVVVLIPYAYAPAGRRAYGLWTVVAALVLPAVASVWVIWLVLSRGVIGRHP
jgi:hypothetical protein